MKTKNCCDAFLCLHDFVQASTLCVQKVLGMHFCVHMICLCDAFYVHIILYRQAHYEHKKVVVIHFYVHTISYRQANYVCKNILQKMLFVLCAHKRCTCKRCVQ